MGYKGDVQRNPAKEALNMVNFALSLIDLIEEVNKKCNCKLKMRIGLHTGEVIGGITGTNIVRYDIYGQDVMLANKMESNGVPGRVAVSEMTKALLEDYECGKFNFEMLKEVKNNKEMINLFLLSQVR
jgi:class 3 adenylate cyclase